MLHETPGLLDPTRPEDAAGPQKKEAGRRRRLSRRPLTRPPGLRHLARCPGDDYVLVLFEDRARIARIAPMARSHAAVKRPPAPSWPQPSTPAGGFARRAGHGAGRPAAVELAAPTEPEVAVEAERPRGRGAQSNASGRYEPLPPVAFDAGWQTF